MGVPALWALANFAGIIEASSIQHNAGIIDNLKSIIVQIVQTKACLEEESVNLYINRYTTPKNIVLKIPILNNNYCNI